MGFKLGVNTRGKKVKEKQQIARTAKKTNNDTPWLNRERKYNARITTSSDEFAVEISDGVKIGVVRFTDVDAYDGNWVDVTALLKMFMRGGK